MLAAWQDPAADRAHLHQAFPSVLQHVLLSKLAVCLVLCSVLLHCAPAVSWLQMHEAAAAAHVYKLTA